MYKVFIDNIPIYFEKEVKFHTNIPTHFFPILNLEKYNELIDHIKHVDLNSKIFVESSKPLMTLLEFFSSFQYLEAAGGLVYSHSDNKYLFIKRNGFWDIPKGKIEKGEKKEDAAVREVQEECGFEKLKLKELITETFHTYFAFGKYHLKKTYWYKMESTEKDNLAPQLEEGITEIMWISKNEWDLIRKNTFLSIEVVLDECSGD